MVTGILYVRIEPDLNFGEYELTDLNNQVCKINIASKNSTEIFYNIIKNYCCTPDAFKQYRNKLLSLESTVLGMNKYVNKIRKISNTIQKIFSVTNSSDKSHKHIYILGIKFSFKYKNKKNTNTTDM